MEYLYLPAVAPGTMQQMEGAGPMNWVDPSLPADKQYHNVLVSYAVWNGKDIPFDKQKGYVFGDSGGFSVVSTGASIDPRKSLRWQMRHCTTGVILDIPPFDFGGQARFVGSAADVWARSTERTRNNVLAGLGEYERYRASGGDFRWWGVVQGETYAQILGWYNYVRNVYPFNDGGEGWALAPKPCNDHLRIARFFRLVREKKFTRIHVLQTSKVSAVGVAMALAQMSGVEFMTNDSATNHINAGNRNVFLASSDGLSGAWMPAAHRTGWEGAADFLTSRCECLSCQHLVNHRDLRLDKPTRYYKDRLAYHNFLTLTRVFYNLAEAARSDPKYLLRHCCEGRELGDVMREYHGESHLVRASDKRTVSVLDRL